VTSGAYDIRPPRIAMYQRYGGGNMDEGWTRLMLEQFQFPFTSVMAPEIRAGNLNAKYDVIVLPADSVGSMAGQLPPLEPAAAETTNAPQGAARGGRGAGGGGRGRGRGAGATAEGPGRQGGRGQGGGGTPPEYRNEGFGLEGVAALRQFVERGGTLVTFAQAGDLPIQRFGLPIRNVVANLSSTQFWCPGSTLRMTVDATHPLAYGLPATSLATFLANSQVYDITDWARRAEVDVLASYAGEDVLQSGWLIGEPVIAGKPAAVSVRLGQGRVVLLGFRAQHRAQTHGTYKFIFNAFMNQ
jgi:hypothetical protein